MAAPVKIKVTLEFQVDPDDWREEYGIDPDMTRAQVKEDAQGLIEGTVRSLVYTKVSRVNLGVARLVLKEGEPECL